MPLTLKECNIFLIFITFVTEYREFLPFVNFITANFITAIFQKKSTNLPYANLCLMLCTPPRTPRISRLNFDVFCKNRYPDMVLVYSIGKSVEGRDLWVTRISKQVRKSHGSRQKRQLLKPWFKIIANTHGNEVSMYHILRLKYFVKAYTNCSLT